MRHAKLLLSMVLVLASSGIAATPKAYLRGPSQAQIDQPIFLKFNGTISDEPVHLEQVYGPEQVAFGYWFDTRQKPIYAVGTASVPGNYRFSLIAEGTPEGQDKPSRSYAFWDVTVSDPLNPDSVTVEPTDEEGTVTAPTGVIPLTIGKPSQSMKLSKGQSQVWFSFKPKARKVFDIQTSGQGAWVMELHGPGSRDNLIDVDENFSGVAANARILSELPPGGTYYIKVKPLLPYLGKSFRIKVASHDLEPGPVPPTPTPTPTPQPEPVPSGDLKVLYLYESSTPMTRGQELVWNSGVVDEALTRLTVPGSDGVPGWRKWDVDTDISGEGPEWSEMMTAIKADLAKNPKPFPVVAVFRGRQGKVHSLPGSVQDMLALIQK